MAGLLAQGLFEVVGYRQFTPVFYYLYSVLTLIIILSFYFMITGVLSKKGSMSYSKSQYTVYVVILGYSFVNIMITANIAVKEKIDSMWAVNIVCITIANIFLLYFIKTTAERNYFENRTRLLEQQAKLQYGYYQNMKEKQEKTMRVLHDVNKHIKAVEGLYACKPEDASAYAGKISDLLETLVTHQYTENPILNILLTDKESVMKEKGIQVDIKIDNVSMDFIEAMDITTIFGNLLDNAIEAADAAEGDRYVCIRIGSRHKMLVISIENSCGTVKWKNGNPVSEKGSDRGIGLMNVRQSVDKYDGNLTLKQMDGRFVAELFLNQ